MQPSERDNRTLTLKQHCRDENIAVTSAVIIMIVRELQERTLTLNEVDQSETTSLGFVLRQ